MKENILNKEKELINLVDEARLEIGEELKNIKESDAKSKIAEFLKNKGYFQAGNDLAEVTSKIYDKLKDEFNIAA